MKSLEPSESHKLEKLDKEIKEIREDTAEIERETKVIRAQNAGHDLATSKASLMKRLNIL